MRKNLLSIIKKPVSLILAVCCVLGVTAFSGCGVFTNSVTMTVNDVVIGEDIFVYFLDAATVELGVDAEYEQLETRAVQLVDRYFKTNSLAAAEGISLTTAEKASVSENVNSAWTIYGNYYSSIGLTRETLTKVYTAEAYRQALMMKFYGKGGIQEIAETRLYANFNLNYTVFQTITGYLTQTDGAGNKKPISKNEAETIVLKFQNVLAMVNSGEQTLEQAADYLASTGLQCAVQTVVLHKDDTSYPAGFFDKIQSLQARKATIISSTDYIFLVVRGETNMASRYFEQMKPEIIMDIADDNIDGIIDGAYIVNNAINRETAQSYLAAIKYEKSR